MGRRADNLHFGFLLLLLFFSLKPLSFLKKKKKKKVDLPLLKEIFPK